jgi:hypothetical protein
MPLFTAAQVKSRLKALTTSTTGATTLEVFTEFPADQSKISEGFYVARTYQADRTKASNGITSGGHIYLVTDRIELYLITQQVNPFVENLLGLFPTLLDDSLFVGYHLREHTIDQQYINNSERYRVVFDLTRLQTI